MLATFGCVGAAVLVIALSIGSACAQDYPIKPIRIVTGASGGGADFIARMIAQGISGPLGQPVIVENRGSGIVQYEYLAKAPPDGYGVVVSGGSFWIFPLLNKVPYDVIADFSPVSLAERSVSIVAVHPSVPAKSIKELIALAKSRPGELNYSSTIAGGPAHLGAELFKSMAGLNIVNVAYKGGGPALTALIGGEVQLYIYDAGELIPHMKSGRLRALAVTSAETSALLPNLPTVAASGLPGYESVGMTPIFVPGKTPTAIIQRLNQEIVRTLNRSDIKQAFLERGSETVGSSPEQLAAIMKSDTVKWSKVIKAAGIRVN